MCVALNGLLRKTVKSRMNGFKNTDRILIVGGTGFIGKGSFGSLPKVTVGSGGGGGKIRL